MFSRRLSSLWVLSERLSNGKNILPGLVYRLDCSLSIGLDVRIISQGKSRGQFVLSALVSSAIV